MRKILAVVLPVLLALGCGKESPGPVGTRSGTEAESAAAPAIDEAQSVELAKAAVQEFAGALQAELAAVMQAGGPVEAISICNTRAMPIARKVSEKHGMILGRVSLNNRNPANAPNEWQTAVLHAFEERMAGGEDPAGIAWSEVAQTEGGEEFRFMKAIPTGEVCLQCHGTEISPGVKEILATLYPGDRATGYRLGDIRGAFVVTR